MYAYRDKWANNFHLEIIKVKNNLYQKQPISNIRNIATTIGRLNYI